MTLRWSPGYAPVDEYYDNVSLLLYGNGTNGSTTITDSSPSPKTVTAVGNAQISTAQSKFGGASLLFDGNGDWCQIANNAAFKFGSGNFTIEYWFYPTSLTGVKQHINPATTTGNVSYAIITNGSALQYYLSSVGGITWNIALGVSMGTATLNTWQHLALVRNGNVFTPYLNGTAGTATTSSDALFDFTSEIRIGSDGGDSPTPFQGYMDDVRITKGGVARYTAAFTPPTESFPDLSPTGRLAIP
jgi:hypothetical protein